MEEEVYKERGKYYRCWNHARGWRWSRWDCSPCSQEGRRKEELVASDCVALSNVGKLHGLSRGKRMSCLGLGVDREAEIPLWVDSSPQIL